MTLLHITKIFPQRQQFSKYHPQKQKLQLGKQPQHNANQIDPAYPSLIQNPAPLWIWLFTQAPSEKFHPVEWPWWWFTGTMTARELHRTRREVGVMAMPCGSSKEAWDLLFNRHTCLLPWLWSVSLEWKRLSWGTWDHFPNILAYFYQDPRFC